MKKIFSILIALALVLGFSLVATTPVAAATINVPGDYSTIQAAVGNASSGDTIIVAPGTYTGAIVDKQVAIVGDAGGASIITSGVPYKASSGLTTAFRLDAGADGTEIRDFTINCGASSSFYFAVFSRAVDNVIVDGLTVNDAVQGISNWGGSGWAITSNTLTDTVAAGGGGTAIFLGALPGTDYPVCSENLIEGNTMLADGTEPGYTSPGIGLALDTRGRAIPGDLSGSEDLSNNRIVGNTITGTGNGNEVGIEIGVIGLGGDTTKVAACLGVIHDNTVENNTIDNAEWGLYTYVTTDLTVSGNTITNCSDCGIYMKDDHVNCLINYNNIYGNTNYGLDNTDGATYTRTVDARYNWWGANDGPGTVGSGDKVSTNVLYTPWTSKTATYTGPGTASFTPDAGSITGLTGVATPPGAPVALPHGMFSFTVTGVGAGGTVIITVELPGPVPVGTKWWKYQGASWYSLPIGSDDGDNIITVTLTDGATPDDADGSATNGQILDDGGPGNPGPVGWETYPVNKVRVLLPWIALLAAIMAGAGLLVLRRRRAQS